MIVEEECSGLKIMGEAPEGVAVSSRE